MESEAAVLAEAVAAGLIPQLDEQGGFWVESPVDPEADPSDPSVDVYFYHTSSGASQFERPEGVSVVKEADLPPELQPQPLDDEGEDQVSGGSTAELVDGKVHQGDVVIDPAALHEWSRQVDDDGDTYFFNARLNQSIWEDPQELVKQLVGEPASQIDRESELASLRAANADLKAHVADLERQLAAARLEAASAKEAEAAALARASWPAGPAGAAAGRRATLTMGPQPPAAPASAGSPAAGGRNRRRQSVAAILAASALGGDRHRKLRSTSRSRGLPVHTEDDAVVASSEGGDTDDDDDWETVAEGATRRLAEGEAAGRPMGRPPPGTLSFLKSVPLLHSLSESQFGEMMGRLRVLSFRQGEVMVRQGRQGDCFYVIAAGRVAVHKLAQADGDDAAADPAAGGQPDSDAAARSRRALPRVQSARSTLQPPPKGRRDSLQRGALFALADGEQEADEGDGAGAAGGAASSRVLHRSATASGTKGRGRGMSGDSSTNGSLGDAESVQSLDDPEDESAAATGRRRLLGPVVAELSKGFFFGERALLTSEMRAASCVAASAEVQCLVLDRESFRECLSGMEDMVGSYGRRFYGGDDGGEHDGLGAHVGAFAEALAEARGEAYQALVEARLIDHAAVTGAPADAPQPGGRVSAAGLAALTEEADAADDDDDDDDPSPPRATSALEAATVVDDEVCGGTASGGPSPLAALVARRASSARGSPPPRSLPSCALLQSASVHNPESGLSVLLARAVRRLRRSVDCEAAFAVLVDHGDVPAGAATFPDGHAAGPSLVIRAPAGSRASSSAAQSTAAAAGSFGGSRTTVRESNPGPLTGPDASCVPLAWIRAPDGPFADCIATGEPVFVDDAQGDGAGALAALTEALVAGAMGRDVSKAWEGASLRPALLGGSGAPAGATPPTTVPRLRDVSIAPIFSGDGGTVVGVVVALNSCEPVPSSSVPSSAPSPAPRVHVRTERVLTGLSDALSSAMAQRSLEAAVLLGHDDCVPQHTVWEDLELEILSATHLPPPKGAVHSKSGAVKRLPSGSAVVVTMTVYHADEVMGVPAASSHAAVILAPKPPKRGSAASSTADAPLAPISAASSAAPSTAAPVLSPSGGREISTAWNQWLQAGIPLSNVPMGARVVFNVAYRDGTQCGWAGMTLFDHLGCLRTGTVALKLWPGAAGEEQALNATVLDNRHAHDGSVPQLAVTLPVFPAPVLAMPDPPLPGAAASAAPGQPVDVRHHSQ